MIFSQHIKKIGTFIAGLLFLQSLHAAQTDTITIRSASMKKDIRCVVITPTGYNSPGKQYPVVYLLHGYSGSYNQWPKVAPQLGKDADEFQMILVCPDGGVSSWYFDSPVDTSFRYETFVSNEVITFIDQHYPTLADRKHRAITGLSMGGHGAFYLGMRHKDVYGAIGSTSGGLDIRPFPKNWDLSKRLGDSICCYENWQKNTVMNLVDGLKNGELAMIFDCGTEDFFLEVNRRFNKKLLDMKIAHDYIERPGGHNSKYWQNSIDYQLLFFNKFFTEKIK